MNGSAMNWDDAKIFLAVARTGNLLGAAKRLGLNHATVSRRLDALEAALGAKLFRRTPAGSGLTESGQRFLPLAERMEADAIAALAAVSGESEAVSGTVRIGAPDGFGTAFLASRLPRLTEKHKALSLQLVPVPRSFSLSRREADIAITVERPTEGRLVAQKLTDYRLGLYASSAYAAAHGLPKNPAELARHALVGHVPDLIASPGLDYVRDFPPAGPSQMSVSSALGQVEAVRAGAGLGILHAFIARTHPDLVEVEGIPPIRRAYFLVYHESVRPLGSVQAAAGFIRAAVEGERALFL